MASSRLSKKRGTLLLVGLFFVVAGIALYGEFGQWALGSTVLGGIILLALPKAPKYSPQPGPEHDVRSIDRTKL